MARELARKLRSKPDPEHWSRKQELGHLVDSAANNHVRIVRAALEAEFRGAPYDQQGWVRTHGYQELPWPSLASRRSG